MWQCARCCVSGALDLRPIDRGELFCEIAEDPRCQTPLCGGDVTYRFRRGPTAPWRRLGPTLAEVRQTRERRAAEAQVKEDRANAAMAVARAAYNEVARRHGRALV